jgi:phosphoserine phosphatase RsbU/P
MPRTNVVFASLGDVRSLAMRCWEPALLAWPFPPAPRSSVLVFSQLGTLLTELEERREGMERPTCVVLGVSRHDHAPDIDTVTMELAAHGVPVLILAEEADRWRSMRDEGVAVLGWDAPPAMISLCVSTLCLRQTYVDGLSRELALAVRCQAGIRAEIERMHEELQLAANVQHEFTAAPLPKLAGLDIGVLYRPVSAVSGDIYCVRAISEHEAAFFVADAVGHGVPAALLTMVLTNSLTTPDELGTPGQNLLSLHKPTEILARLNRRMIDGSMNSGRFATAVYGVIDARTREVRVASAGHPKPIVYGRGGTRTIDVSGPLLGVFPDAEFEEVRFSLDEDEAVLLHTDGLEAAFQSEAGAKQPKRFMGEVQRLLSQGFHQGQSGLRDAMSDLEMTLDEQSGSLHQQDDVTALIIGAAPRAARIAA